MRDCMNRARWSQDQRQKARVHGEDAREVERRADLAAYRQQIAAFEPMAGDPTADRVIATARAEIARLST